MSSSISIWKRMLRRKPLEPPRESQLKRTLTAFDLILYGVGSSVGAGIYCLVGIGAGLAGPAISVSFLCCGIACIFTSLAYAEFAARIPVTGSAYVYAYTTFGEVWGWLVGWNLTLGYGFAASVVARSWGEYVGSWMTSVAQQFGWKAFESSIIYFTKFPIYGDYTCSPLSTVIVALSTYILKNGAKESSKFNNLMTCFNIGVLFLVIIGGLPVISFENLQPFFPTGATGVARGSGLVFFAFIGFDMVACLSEEVVNPGRNMPIGIVGSLVISAIIYVAISLTVVGMAPISLLGGDVPITNALLANACCSHEEQMDANAADVCLSNTCSPLMHPVLMICSRVVSGGAIFALTAACFVGLMGQPRIFYSMAKDGLLFPIFGVVNPETHVPTAGIMITGVVGAALACFVDLQVLANVISLGTLLVFTFVDAAVIILRLRPALTHMNFSDQAFVFRTPPISRSNSTTAQASLNSSPEAPVPGTSVRSNGSKPSTYVTMFAASTLFLSFGIRDSWHQSILVVFGLLSLFFTIALLRLPRSAPPSTFQCPLVPIIPLLGMGANLFMAGALPTSSWMLSMGWMSLGLAVYLLYGMHNSTLGKEVLEEGHPLLIAGSPHYNAIPSGATLMDPMEPST